MGTWAQYEEKEFETLANVALVTGQIRAGQPVTVFSPGQVLEKTLGFDFSTHLPPDSRLYRRLFGSVPGATGISASQAQSKGLPPASKLLNLFIQYKRPEFFEGDRHRSALWPKQTSFLRFSVAENGPLGAGQHFEQVHALAELASSLGGDALVRYACPGVWQKQDLYDVFAAGQLLQGCAFVEPALLVDPTKREPVDRQYHRRWTFDPVDVTTGKPNPDGSLTQAENGEKLFEAAARGVPTAPTADGFLHGAAQFSTRVKKVRPVLEERSQRLSGSEQRRRSTEERQVDEDLLRVPPSLREPVRAFGDVLGLARDADVKWSVLSYQ